MTMLRVAAGALNQTPLDWDGNRNRIVAAIRSAREHQVGLLCLPELCISGYGCEDGFHSAGTWRLSLDVLGEILPETGGLCVTLGLPLFVNGALYNVAAVVLNRQVIGFVPKQHLAGDGVHYEPRWFKPWPKNTRTAFDFDGLPCPVGDLLFEIGGVRLGFEICEDAWVHDRPGAGLARRAVDVICNPSASHFAFGKSEVRERFVIDGSRAFGCAYVYANLLGNEAGRIIYDGHTMVAAGGSLVAQGRRFSYLDETSTVADIDVAELRAARARSTNYHPDLGGDGVVDAAFDWPEPRRSLPSAQSEAQLGQEDEFTRAVCLGLRDYARKSGSQGFVVSLSGGADSAAVVALIGTMIDLAGREIGLNSLASQLRIGHANTPEALAAAILTTAYQSTRNSSVETRSAARSLAESIGATHHELDVDSITQGYTTLIEGAIGLPLSWETDDITLQNIQARVRSPGIWMFANIENKLLLTTSNRSEAAVGYATMDGDTSGGLAPIAGIDKAFLRRWLAWMASTGPIGGKRISELAVVNALVPTAELRPIDQSQTDENDLMPYPVLDAIEEAVIGRKLPAKRVLEEVTTEFTDYPAEQVRHWLDRFYGLWSRNQWKRERYAPAFHLDDRNLDPKTWCRFPILSGGFHREMRGLIDDSAS
ncbi:MAG: NAD(+) synthase [Planctomycetota bacterium]